MPTPQTATKQTLTLIVLALAMAVFFYIGLTYLVPGVAGRPALPEMRLVLLAISVLTAVIALFAERMLLDRAKTPQGIQQAAIVTSSLAEVSAIMGLLYFFLTGRREWAFFVLSLISYARILLRLPEYHRLMDQT